MSAADTPLWAVISLSLTLLVNAAILALAAACGGVLLLGEAGIGKLLVLSQVALSFQLPFATGPLIRLTRDTGVMGRYANGLRSRSFRGHSLP